MEIIVFLSIVIAVGAVLTSTVLVRRVKKQIAEMTDVLVDVKNGNGNRRILSATNELTAPLAYEINEIVVAYESRLSTVRQTEETNRQLMTSLSHDVRTPLTTLIGYLDAAHKGLVTGKDRDDYIETARRKAHDLKEYIDVLFDWFKLNSNEFALEIQSVEAAELTRNILIDWIPIFEDKQVEYDIDIPEQPVRVRLDMDSYMRIVNNLIQNVITHRTFSIYWNVPSPIVQVISAFVALYTSILSTSQIILFNQLLCRTHAGDPELTAFLRPLWQSCCLDDVLVHVLVMF